MTQQKNKTMLPIKKTTLFWICFFVIFCGLIYLLHGILLPFVLGFVLAYMLNPIVLKLQKWHFSRIWGTLVVILGLLLSLLTFILILIPVLQVQISTFIKKLPNLSAALWDRILPMFEVVKNHISETQMDYLKQTVSSHAATFFAEISNSLMEVFSSWGALFDIISFIVITPVVSFYILADWPELTAQIKHLYPRHYAKFLNEKMGQIDQILSAFIRGQALVCLFLGLFYGIGLSVIGLDFGFSIGFISGVFSFIPYVGSICGFILSLLLAFTQSATWSIFAGILIVFGLGQFIEGYILTPKLVGNKIHLHPVWVIFALLAGGYLFGFLGILIAVPLAAVLGVVVRTLVDFYEKSLFYKGSKKL